MPSVIRCSHCQAKLKASVQPQPGQRYSCPRCQNAFTPVEAAPPAMALEARPDTVTSSPEAALGLPPPLPVALPAAMPVSTPPNVDALDEGPDLSAAQVKLAVPQVI